MQIKLMSDHNIAGQVARLYDQLLADGWAELLNLALTTLAAENLPVNTNDRILWRFVQRYQYFLITSDRRQRGDDALTLVVAQENHAQALPILIVSDATRLYESDYRIRCAVRLVEIVLSIDDFRGAGYLYIP